MSKTIKNTLKPEIDYKKYVNELQKKEERLSILIKNKGLLQCEFPDCNSKAVKKKLKLNILNSSLNSLKMLDSLKENALENLYNLFLEQDFATFWLCKGHLKKEFLFLAQKYRNLPHRKFGQFIKYLWLESHKTLVNKSLLMNWYPQICLDFETYVEYIKEESIDDQEFIWLESDRWFESFMVENKLVKHINKYFSDNYVSHMKFLPLEELCWWTDLEYLGSNLIDENTKTLAPTFICKEEKTTIGLEVLTSPKRKIDINVSDANYSLKPSQVYENDIEKCCEYIEGKIREGIKSYEGKKVKKTDIKKIIIILDQLFAPHWKVIFNQIFGNSQKGYEIHII